MRFLSAKPVNIFNRVATVVSLVLILWAFAYFFGGSLWQAGLDSLRYSVEHSSPYGD
jgi:hypothetical protein